MSKLWQFSEVSQPYLQRILEATNTDYENEWSQIFGHNTSIFREICLISDKNDEENESTPRLDSQASEEHVSSEIKSNETKEEVIDKTDMVTLELSQGVFDITDVDPVTHFDFIVKQCLNSPGLYSTLAQDMPTISAEKLSEHVFGAKNINETFLENFFILFLPAFLKRDHTLLALDLVVKAHKSKLQYFKRFLEIIIKDEAIPSNIVQDFAATLGKNEQTELLMNLLDYNLSKEILISYIQTVQTLYKACDITEDIQNSVLTLLTQISVDCANDKNYGRLLLSYLQMQRNFTTSNCLPLENLIECHKSAFKRPCMNICNEIKNKM